ncbi:granzyme B-like [Megalobrama amblycephala]|uniref:granzyme B-like n=1 Tax=Megalobrama amblycephala TaxID=75352 RepID=UPI002013EBB3|nr:granzyme B-like [Megalobrama amblycephala]
MILYAFLLLIGISLAGGMESGIIGGKEAIPHSRPYMASIQIKNKHHICGGMLIRKDYVLTAAHCFNRSDYSGQDHLEVVLGAHNVKKDEKSQQRIPVIKYIPHSKFERKNESNNDYSYDIMLLKLKNNAKLNTFVKVMPLPKKNGKTPANVKCYIAGWGLINPKAVVGSNVLREVALKLQENSECERMWQHYFNSERMLCGVSDGKHAFCQGDSGSPLICNSKPQGIVSYTYDGNCANIEYPQAYVNISYFLPWIKKKIG